MLEYNFANKNRSPLKKNQEIVQDKTSGIKISRKLFPVFEKTITTIAYDEKTP